MDWICVVDDGSPDKSAQMVLELKHPRVKLLRHDKNLGPGAALLTGYRAALNDGIDITVKVDGDGQMPPEQMENLILPIVEGKADYTKGDRISNPGNRQNMPRFRLFGNLLLTWLTRIASGYWRLSDPQNGYTAISAKALKCVLKEGFYQYYGYLNDILVTLKMYSYTIQDVPMSAIYGNEKSSIRLGVYVVKVSLLLLFRLIKRLKGKIIHRKCENL